MEPKKFKEANITFTKPASMTDSECGSLPAYRNRHQIISCWRPTWKERLKILFTGSVWIGVRGQSQPPMWASGELPFYRASLIDNAKYWWSEIIEFVTSFIKSFGSPDKPKHYYAGMIISAIVLIITSSPLLAFIIGAIAGALKEFVWDKWMKRGHFEWYDLMWTCAGSAVISGLYWIIRTSVEWLANVL